MNLGQVRTLVRQEINDKVKSAEATDILRWSATELTTQILFSADWVAQEFFHIQGTKQFSTTAGTPNYAFVAADYFLGYSGAITSLWYSDGSNWTRLNKNNHVNMDQYLMMYKDSSQGAPPSAWTLWNQSVYLYPAPNYSGTNNLEVYHYKGQQSRTAVTDDSEDLDGDRSLHYLIGLHAAKEIMTRDRQMEMAALVNSKYETELKRQRAKHRPAFDGPQFTRYEEF